MSDASRLQDAQVIPERFRWALRLLLTVAVLWTLVSLVGLVLQVTQLVNWVQPGARVPVTFSTSFELKTNGGQNSYGGGPFVQDGQSVTVTQVATTLNGVPLINRILLGAAPIVWSLTGVGVALLLGFTIRRLIVGTSFGRGLARPVVLAAVVLAIGSSVAQFLELATPVAFGAFAWAAPSGYPISISRASAPGFQFGPLLAACGLLVVALVVRRGLALQRDVDGLV
ncbi:hypothetical protein [Amnibacterium setariae]|uniref:DUF2975 domain-containing protein n=1 Tax=Amnibacterium setariae TaxID=2306585 RepID=A0A3A1TZ86_9MICO|nr:hypothetical protein [Amnibacterium setariae]RIX29964.1 hypothetical protein D1781_00330 [Amnibacterium setariae]